MSTRLPALLRILLAGLLALASSAFAATADFTPAERASLKQLADHVKADCVRQMALVAAKSIPEVDASPVGRMFKINDWPGYCPCVAAEVQRLITPDKMRYGTEKQGEAIVLAAATACVVRHLQERFPPICHAMVDSSAPDSFMRLLQAHGDAPANPPALDPAAVDQFCKCVQGDIDKLNADNFDGFSKLTIHDYTAYRRTGQLPEATGPSLLATMQRCGGVTLYGAKAQASEK